VNFELVPRALGLEEIVVTGSAGPTRVREIGHSIAQIDPAHIPEPIISWTTCSPKSSGPGRCSELGDGGLGRSDSTARCYERVAQQPPLIYVDGVRIRATATRRIFQGPESPTAERATCPVLSNDIDPDDVERVEIVRGPAATALYGTEAATGVIQIFTKRGIVGKPLWSSRIVFGEDRVQKFGTATEPYMRIDPWLKTAQRMTYSLSTGGGNQVRYYVSGRFRPERRCASE
jgi:TonB-dependent SusC/RagA subfamily outer membrane receptor